MVLAVRVRDDDGQLLPARVLAHVADQFQGRLLGAAGVDQHDALAALDPAAVRDEPPGRALHVRHHARARVPERDDVRSHGRHEFLPWTDESVNDGGPGRLRGSSPTRPGISVK